MIESVFQSNLIDELEIMFPDCIILKNDPNYIQGFPDLTIFYNDKWAVLECKRSAHAMCRPNQKYYVETLNKMSFSRFIYPENKEEVLDELQQTFTHRRATRISKC